MSNDNILESFAVIVGSRSFAINDSNSDYDMFINEPNAKEKEHTITKLEDGTMIDKFIYNFKSKEDLYYWHLNENKDPMNIGHLINVEVLKYFDIDIFHSTYDRLMVVSIFNKYAKHNTLKSWVGYVFTQYMQNNSYTFNWFELREIKRGLKKFEYKEIKNVR